MQRRSQAGHESRGKIAANATIWQRFSLNCACALSLACGPVQAARGDNGQPPPPRNDTSSDATVSDTLQLQEIVVTATVTAATKMQTSLSVSTLPAARIQQLASVNAADTLRAVPGIRAEASGGEGNANITVRGLPISAGGARYVQLQEDGLPILQFGDIAFGTADEFLRLDSGLDRIEAVRGGSASTLATNAPGGVINFISRTGERAGGLIGIDRDIDHARTRYDFSYGQPSAAGDTRFFVAGFYRDGDGARDTGVNVARGGQLRGNATREFDSGYLRLNVKYLDDHVPMALPVPVATHAGHISALPGIDPRTASFYSPYWAPDRTIDANNAAHVADIDDGLHVTTHAVGAEASFELADDVAISDRFRIAANSGRFIGIFPADNGYTDGPFTVATGPEAGQPYAGPVFTATVFDVAIDDLGNTFNDFTLKKTAYLGDGDTLDTAVGLYSSVQRVELTWSFNQYLLAADGSKPALIASADTSAATPGLIAAGTDVWGGCCSRHIDAKYTTQSPYAGLTWNRGDWTLDASVRRDRQSASGTFNLAENQQFTTAAAQRIDYALGETSYSFGANYLVSPELALFARRSEGYAFNADRILFNGFALDGSVAVPVNRVRQNEGGVKWRRGDWSTFVTYFAADTRETNYEATTQTFTDRIYRADGVELESAYDLGGFSLRGGATYTRATIRRAEDATLEGNVPRRQATWIYQLLPAYRFGKMTLSAAIIGTGAAWGDDANSIRLPAYTVVNLYGEYALNARVRVSLAVNNAGNTLAYTEVESDGHAARALDGRTLTAAMTYRL